MEKLWVSTATSMYDMFMLQQKIERRALTSQSSIFEWKTLKDTKMYIVLEICILLAGLGEGVCYM